MSTALLPANRHSSTVVASLASSAASRWCRRDADRRELHALVEALPDEAIGPVLAALRSRLHAGVACQWPPVFVGMGGDRDGRRDLSECVDEVLAAGFGAARP